MLHAERSSLLLLDPQTGELWSKQTLARTAAQARMGWCVDMG
jgi:hypothetical protein